MNIKQDMTDKKRACRLFVCDLCRQIGALMLTVGGVWMRELWFPLSHSKRMNVSGSLRARRTAVCCVCWSCSNVREDFHPSNYFGWNLKRKWEDNQILRPPQISMIKTEICLLLISKQYIVQHTQSWFKNSNILLKYDLISIKIGIISICWCFWF